jgi:hypothetical protein
MRQEAPAALEMIAQLITILLRPIVIVSKASGRYRHPSVGFLGRIRFRGGHECIGAQANRIVRV